MYLQRRFPAAAARPKLPQIAWDAAGVGESAAIGLAEATVHELRLNSKFICAP